MDRKTIDSLAVFVRDRFPEEGMEICTGMDMLTAALERISENLILESEALSHKGDLAGVNSLAFYQDAIGDLIYLFDAYSEVLDLSEAEDA